MRTSFNILLAFEFVSGARLGEHPALLCRTGKIY